jgi:GT2 family glycosyltransferase
MPWASGCAMRIRSDMIRQLGGFDDRYFLNWEDVDLCLRLRGLGSKVALVPSARIYHKVSRSFAATFGMGNYYHVRNNLLLVSLYSGNNYHRAALAIVAMRLREILRAIKNRSSTSVTPLRMFLRAIRDHALQRYGPYKI